MSGIGKRSVEDWETGSSYVDEKARYEEDLKTWEEDMKRWEREERERKDEIVNNWFSSLVSSFTGSSTESNVEARLGVSFTDASFLAVLDDTFTFASTTKQFVLNAMGVGFFCLGSKKKLRIMISQPIRLLAACPSSLLCLTCQRMWDE